MMRREKGSHTVEFSIVGAAFFLLLFGALEVGRLMYTLHGLTEATRRGARVAAVCPVNDAKIANVAVFGDPDSGGSGLIPSLTPDKLELAYLDDAGSLIGDPSADFLDIRYVRVSVDDFSHQFLIPGLSNTVQLPELSTTLPRESLGVPRDGLVECPF